MAAPDRAFWPLMPRPHVLPLPEPIPRPTRMRGREAPGLSRISFSFIASPLTLLRLFALIHDANEMSNLGDHAAHGGIILNGFAPSNLVEPEPGQDRSLRPWPANWAFDLLDDNPIRLCGHDRTLCFAGRLGIAGLAAGREDARRVFLLERVKRRSHHIVWVGRALRFGDDVVHSESLEDGAHRAPGDDPGASRSRPQDHPPGAVSPGDIMMQGAPFAQRHPDKRALGRLGCLANGFGDLAGLAVAIADPALLIADHNESGKPKPSAAFNDLGNAIDMDQAVNKIAFAVLAVAAPAALSLTRHCSLSILSVVYPGVALFCRLATALQPELKCQPALARPLGQRFHPAVIHVSAAIEHDLLNPGHQSALRDLLADRPCRVNCGAALQAFAVCFFERGCSSQCPALRIVDDLAINLL